MVLNRYMVELLQKTDKQCLDGKNWLSLYYEDVANAHDKFVREVFRTSYFNRMTNLGLDSYDTAWMKPCNFAADDEAREKK